MTTPRTWFITGTSSGFGRELTELLLTQGERVAATSRKIDGLNELKAQYGDLLWVRSMDVTDTAAVRQVVDEAFQELGHIDVVVNNAGYALFGAAEEVTDEQIIQQINTNLDWLDLGHSGGPASPAGAGRRAHHASIVGRRLNHLSELQPIPREQMGH